MSFAWKVLGFIIRAMEKQNTTINRNQWMDFLSSRLRAQISLENAQKAQTWAFGLLSFFMFGSALGATSTFNSTSFYFETKVLFLFLFHMVMILGIYLPALFLQKGQKPVARLLGIRDSVTLVFLGITMMFYSLVVLSLSFQVASQANQMELSAFALLSFWVHFTLAAVYTLGCVFSFSSFVFSPGTLVKFFEKSSKVFYVLFGFHIVLLLSFALSYSEMVPIGGSDFFEQFRAVGLFWIFIISSVFFVVRLFFEFSADPLAALELDVATGRLERSEDILTRFKNAFASSRLFSWCGLLSRILAERSHEIARFSHEAVSLVSPENPSEVDLRQVEDRYRRAEALSRKLERENQRFLVSILLFDLNEVERQRVEELRDQFSRELRNAKLELATIRKRIDEKLTVLKDRQMLPSFPKSTNTKAAETVNVPQAKV
ncbi:MAG: hypothetical protein NC930_07590 [Candidatus Omnitrophica bacterium]|nr:hypothetical protein [Candidatus Omnitrophota bacterium]